MSESKVIPALIRKAVVQDILIIAHKKEKSNGRKTVAVRNNETRVT